MRSYAIMPNDPSQCDADKQCSEMVSILRARLATSENRQKVAQARIEELEKELTNEREGRSNGSHEMLTIAYMSGGHDYRAVVRQLHAKVEALEWLVEVLMCHPRKTDGDTDLKRFYAACDELAATQSDALAATEVK